MKSIIGKNKSTVVLKGASGIDYHFIPHSIVSSESLGERHVPKIFLIINKEEDETGNLKFQPAKIGITDDLCALVTKVHELYEEKIGTGSFYYADLDDSSTYDRLVEIVKDILDNGEEYPMLSVIHCSGS